MSFIQKLNFLLPSEKKRQLFILTILLLIGIVFEMAGLGILIPALTLMLKSDISHEYPSVRPFLQAIGNPSQVTLVLLGMSVLVIVYFLKALFLIFLTWKQAKFNSELSTDLSKSLFLGYMRMPYSFHLERNSSKLLSNIQTELGSLYAAGQSIIILITESSLTLSVFALLVWVEPIGAFSVILFLGLSAGLFHRLTHNKLKTWGQKRILYVSEMNKQLLEGFGGVKDVKLMGRENHFSTELSKNLIKSKDITIKQVTLQQVPRFYLELLAVVGLGALITIMALQAKPLDQLIPTLGIFVAAAFRMIPSLNRIMGSIQTIHYVKPTVSILYEEFKLVQETTNSRIATSNLEFNYKIAVNTLTIKYPGANAEALKDVSLVINKGESIGFIGPSGSGKSTLVDIILGLLSPSEGKVTVDDIDIQENIRQWQDLLGYVPQSIYLTDDTLRRNIAFGISDADIDEQAINRTIKSAHLEEFIEHLPKGLDTVVGERGVRLSGGQRQRIGIARALYNNPSVLVLDEATSALDNKTESEVMKAIVSMRGSKTIIIVAHRLSTVANCDRIYKLSQGKVVEVDTPENILKAI